MLAGGRDYLWSESMMMREAPALTPSIPAEVFTCAFQCPAEEANIQAAGAVATWRPAIALPAHSSFSPNATAHSWRIWLPGNTCPDKPYPSTRKTMSRRELGSIRDQAD